MPGVRKAVPVGTIRARRLAAMGPIHAAIENRGCRHNWLAKHAGASAGCMGHYLGGRYPWPVEVFDRVCFLLEMPREEVLRLEKAEVLFQAPQYVARTAKWRAKREVEAA